MKALYDVEYPTPQPIGHNRHIVAMGLVRGAPLYQVHSNRVSAEQAESIFQQSAALASRLAAHGLVHCDLNEFNLMVDLSGIQNAIAEDNDVAEHYVRHSGMSVVSQGALSAHGPLQKHQFDGTGEVITEAPPEPKEFLKNGEPKPTVTLIDFPQMVSTRHPNAEELYNRDLNCLKRFFVTKLKCVPDQGWDELIPKWEDVIQPVSNLLVEADHESTSVGLKAQLRLDEELRASGFSEKDSSRDLELYYYNPMHELGQNDDEEVSENEQEDLADGPAAQPGNKQDDEVPDIDNDSVESAEKDIKPVFNLLDDDQRSVFTSQTRAMAEEKAKARVRQHIEERRKKTSRKGAFQSRNNNKTFVKGKRIYDDLTF
jgi:serine/threonine-protein kinase RIO1